MQIKEMTVSGHILFNEKHRVVIHKTKHPSHVVTGVFGSVSAQFGL